MSNELWLYNTTLDEWRLLKGQEGDPADSNQSGDGPPGLMYATLTLVDNQWIYLFGGSLEHGEFSSRMYRINLGGDRVWERVSYGFENLCLLYAHTPIYSQLPNHLTTNGCAPTYPHVSCILTCIPTCLPPTHKHSRICKYIHIVWTSLYGTYFLLLLFPTKYHHCCCCHHQQFLI